MDVVVIIVMRWGWAAMYEGTKERLGVDLVSNEIRNGLVVVNFFSERVGRV